MSASNKTVIIAEDDAYLGDMIQRSLASNGVKAVVARNGKEVIAALEKKKPDVLLLDLLMPEIDGYGVLKYLEEKGFKIPTVIVSNLSSAADRDACKKFGCKAFIVKSDIDAGALWPMIEKYLG